MEDVLPFNDTEPEQFDSDLMSSYLIGQPLLSHGFLEEYRIDVNHSVFNQNRTIRRPLELAADLSVPYALFETLVAVLAVIGNAAVMIVFQQEKGLQKQINYYIVSLALADFLVGLLGVPFAIMASVGLPRNLHACLCTISLLVVLCTISIFCLVAVSIDRYFAVVLPMKHRTNVSRRTTRLIISLCWIAGSIVGFLPLLGWHAPVQQDQACLFVEVMDYSYLVFLYFATIITPAVLLAGFYAHIYFVIINLKRPEIPAKGTTEGKIIRNRDRDIRATKNLSIIVLFFMICWVPLYTINCINFFCSNCLVDPKLTNFCIILSHLNSALNPVLYAYHLRDFRKALRNAMLRMCGMAVPPEPSRSTNSLSMISYHQNLLAERRTPSQRRIYAGSTLTLQPKCSPSPRSRFSTHSLNHRPGIPSSFVSLTAATHCNLWHVITETNDKSQEPQLEFTTENGGDTITRATPSPPVQRVRFDDVTERQISVRPLSNSSDESGVSLSSAPDADPATFLNSHKDISSYDIASTEDNAQQNECGDAELNVTQQKTTEETGTLYSCNKMTSDGLT